MAYLNILNIFPQNHRSIIMHQHPKSIPLTHLHTAHIHSITIMTKTSILSTLIDPNMLCLVFWWWWGFKFVFWFHERCYTIIVIDDYNIIVIDVGRWWNEMDGVIRIGFRVLWTSCISSWSLWSFRGSSLSLFFIIQISNCSWIVWSRSRTKEYCEPTAIFQSCWCLRPSFIPCSKS